jgi:MOSC domain-containing protein YiiM
MEELQGIVRNVLVMEPGKSPVSTPREQLRLIPGGIEGDTHAGLTRTSSGEEVCNTRQVSLVSVDELGDIAWAMDLPSVEAGWIGANLLLDGIPDLSRLPPGSRLVFRRETVLVVAEENTPCTSAGRAVQEQYPDKQNLSSLFPKAALGNRGLLAWVEQPGEIRVGDKVRAQLPS